MSIKLRNFALAKSKDRDLAQLVAHTSGGREVAGSSPVIPTERKSKPLIVSSLDFFFALSVSIMGINLSRGNHHSLHPTGRAGRAEAVGRH